MKTKLILVEGLPGFGKSTTAKLINEVLIENGIETELFLEGNLDHPADYDGVAFFEKNEFEDLISISGEFKEVFMNRAMKRKDGYVLPYQKIKNEYGSKLPVELLHKIVKNDIYELPLEKNMELVASKWAEFAKKVQSEQKTYVFECCFIQNPLTMGRIKYGAPKEIVADYVFRLANIVEGLHPVLFYVDQNDLEFSFKKAVQERPQEWSNGFIHYYTSQGYGKQHQYEGLEGTIKVLEARRELELGIFSDLKMKKEVINNSQYETAKYKALIIQKLKEFEVLQGRRRWSQSNS